MTSGLLFNFTTNGNPWLLSERFRGIVEDPVLLGVMLAAVYAQASLTQRPRASARCSPSAPWRWCH